MKKYLFFGESVDGYSEPVLNEREARAAAGILFLFGLISFFNAYMEHDFRLTQIFVTLFMVDFTLRVLVNPRYSPSLILGRLFVSNQKPEYVGAKQKRFAWSIGLILSIPMFFILVVFEYMTYIKVIICLLCLSLLFFEASFGICLGCKLYQFFSKQKAQYCPGDVCEPMVKEEIQRVSKFQWAILVIVLVGVTGATVKQFDGSTLSEPVMKCESGKCGAGKCGGGM